MKITYSPYFKKVFKKIPQEIKKLAVEKEKIFRNNPFDQKLKTHKLHGKIDDCWAFSVNYSYRIIFEFRENEEIWFHNIGNHDIY